MLTFDGWFLKRHKVSSRNIDGDDESHDGKERMRSINGQ